MIRFLVSRNSISDNRVTIQGKELHHLRNVLRLRKGERVAAFDGEGKEYQGVLKEVGPRQAIVAIDKVEVNNREPAIRITLVQAIVRSAKMDFIIQKATELGVSQIIPLVTERSFVHLEGERELARHQRWKRIAGEAARQSGRTTVPRINSPQEFPDLLREMRKDNLNIILWEEERKRGLKQVLRSRDNVKEIALLGGPEGGFGEEEVFQARKAGMVPASLGFLILRAETAAIAALSMVIYEFG